MIKRNRQQAKALGLNKCYGSACYKHPELEGLRWVSGACIECAKENLRRARKNNPERTRTQYKKHVAKAKLNPEFVAKKRARDVEYRKRNKEKCAKLIKEWSKQNPEKVKLYAKQTKQKNAEKIRLAGIKYRQENPEKRKATTRAWRQNNRPKVTAAQRRRQAAKLQRTPKWLTEDDHWIMLQAYELAALRTEMLGFVWHVDHIIPLRGKTVSGLHVPTNLQVIPGVENMRKLNKFDGVEV